MYKILFYCCDALRFTHAYNWMQYTSLMHTIGCIVVHSCIQLDALKFTHAYNWMHWDFFIHTIGCIAVHSCIQLDALWFTHAYNWMFKSYYLLNVSIVKVDYLHLLSQIENPQHQECSLQVCHNSFQLNIWLCKKNFSR